MGFSSVLLNDAPDSFSRTLGFVLQAFQPAAYVVIKEQFFGLKRTADWKVCGTCQLVLRATAKRSAAAKILEAEVCLGLRHAEHATDHR